MQCRYMLTRGETGNRGTCNHVISTEFTMSAPFTATYYDVFCNLHNYRQSSSKYEVINDRPYVEPCGRCEFWAGYGTVQVGGAISTHQTPCCACVPVAPQTLANMGSVRTGNNKVVNC